MAVVIPFHTVHQLHDGGVGNSESARHLVRQIDSDKFLFSIVADLNRTVLETVGKSLYGSSNRLGLGVCSNQQNVGRFYRCYSARLEHGAKVGQV